MFKIYKGDCSPTYLKSRRVVAGIWIMLLAGFIPAMQNLQARPLQKFIDDALKRNPVLKAQVHKTKAKQSEADAESIFIKNPVLSLAHSNIPIASWPTLNSHAMSGLEFSISQTFSFPWESAYRKRARFKLYLSQQQIEKEIRATLIMRVKKTYHELYFLFRKEQLLKESRISLNNILTQARALVSIDKMSSSNLLKLGADLSILDNEILRDSAAIVKAQAKIESLCNITYSWNNQNDVKDWQSSSSLIVIPDQFEVKNHPLYKAVTYNFEAAKANLSQSMGNAFPNVTLGASYRYRQEVANKDAGEDFISFKASMPFPLYYPIKERHEINAKEQHMLTLKEERSDIMLQLSKKWQGEFGKATRLKLVYEKFEREVLPGYLASFKAQRGALSAGTVSLLDLLDSYRQYLRVSILSASTYKDLRHSIAFLEYLQTSSHSKGKIK